MKLLTTLGLLLGTTFSLLAVPLQYGKRITISQPVFRDLYIAGATVIINAPIHGDLIVGGGTVYVNDSVTNDILVAGGKVIFNGYVGDDVRCAGGDLRILRTIAGDVVCTGGTLLVEKGSTIGNLITSVGEIKVDGTVTGGIKSMSGSLILNGSVLKDIDCRGGKLIINGTVNGGAILASNDKIVINKTAFFGGTVRYWTPHKRIDFNNSLQGPAPIYDPSLKLDYDRWYFLGFSSILGLFWYLGMVVTCIICLQYVFSPILKQAGKTLFDTKWKTLGYGLLFWMGIPVAAVLAIITLIGAPIGLILLVGYALLVALAKLITSVVAANWLNNFANGEWTYWQKVFASLGIFAVLKILSFTPFLGSIVLFLLICLAFGAILFNINWRRQPVARTQKSTPVKQSIS